MKGRCIMISKKCGVFFCATICCLLINSMIFGANAGDLSAKKLEYEQERTRIKAEQEYKQERARIKALEKAFTPGPTNDLKKYEYFADRIQNKWKGGNKEYYARLMLEVCGPLGSGKFKDKRCYDLRRQYALSALEEPNDIALVTELELTGRVITFLIGHKAPEGEDFAQRRKKDVKIRLHAWKRLLDAIDPNWDPNDLPLINVTPPTKTGLPPGISHEAIEDSVLRAEYKAAIEKNRQKAEIYRQQSKLRKWLKRFPRRAEGYMIRAYSKSPYNLPELEKALNKYLSDEKTKAKIIESVKTNIKNKTKENK